MSRKSVGSYLRARDGCLRKGTDDRMETNIVKTTILNYILSRNHIEEQNRAVVSFPGAEHQSGLEITSGLATRLKLHLMTISRG